MNNEQMYNKIFDSIAPFQNRIYQDASRMPSADGAGETAEPL